MSAIQIAENAMGSAERPSELPAVAFAADIGYWQAHAQHEKAPRLRETILRALQGANQVKGQCQLRPVEQPTAKRKELGRAGAPWLPFSENTSTGV